MKHRIHHLTLALSLAGIISAGSSAPLPLNGAETIRRPAAEEYREPATGLAFPGRMGAFLKTEAIENENPVFGVTIRYQNENASCADIYLYSLDTSAVPAGKEAFRRECTGVEQRILLMGEKHSLIESVSLLPPDDAEKNLPDGLFLRRFEIRLDGETVHSRLAMFLYGGKIVKLRVSYPAGDPGEKADAFLFEQELLKLAGFKFAPGKGTLSPAGKNGHREHSLEQGDRG